MKPPNHTNIPKKLIQACRYIEESETLPTLNDTARQVHLSPTHFQKIFTKALGISPRQYAAALRFQKLRQHLRTQTNIAASLYEAGFGASSRLYEFAGRYLGMTPKTYKTGGQGAHIFYSIVQSPLGYLLLAATQKGICTVRLGSHKKALLQDLHEEFKAARLIPNSKHIQPWLQALVNYLAGRQPWPLLPYDVRATAFQRRVWDWLRTIPTGTTYHYSAAAKALGLPKAVRAVARACASNPIALVIPCHRIIPKAGGIGGYRWDPKRKKFLLSLEKAILKSPSRKRKRYGQFYVYIAKDKHGTYYTGYTQDITQRLRLHNTGRGAKYLRGKAPITLVFKQEYRYYKSALNAERKIKTFPRAKKEKLVKKYAVENRFKNNAGITP